MFDKDNSFLIRSFEEAVTKLDQDTINKAKENNSYYNFHIKTDEFIMVPKKFNFNFKYLHLIKEYDAAYWNMLVKAWRGYIGDQFLDPTEHDDKKQLVISQFNNIISSNYFGVNPNIVNEDDTFIYYENLESRATPMHISPSSASLFKKLYTNINDLDWNGLRVFLFPVNDLSFYGMVDGQLKMLYPVWNSYRWSTELPKFICNTKEPQKLCKFEPFDIYKEQESIRLMNNAIPREKFEHWA